MAMNEHEPGASLAGGERDAALDRLYRQAAGDAGPPARLDAAILAAAHRAVGAGPRARPTALRRWQLPVSIAAVVLLSVSLVTLVREAGEDPLRLAPEAPPPAKSPAPEPPTLVPERAKAPAAAPLAAPAPAESRQAVRSRAPLRAAQPGDEAARAGPGAALQGAGAPAPAAPPAAEPETAARPSPGLRDAPAVPAAAGQLAAAEDAAEHAAGVRGDAAPKEVAPGRAQMRLRTRSEAVVATGPDAVWRDFEREPPARWLERIAELRKRDRMREADAMQAEFDRRFPGYRARPEGDPGP